MKMKQHIPTMINWWRRVSRSGGKSKRVCLSLFCGLLLALAPPGQALDLLERYPTPLTAGDLAGERAREWQFTETDVFRLARFGFEVGQDLKVETGTADLGIGHCADGAVWAVVLPRSGGTVTHQAANPEAITHVWLRFHPGQINRVFPPETVFADGAGGLTAQIRAIANAKMTSSYQAGGRAMIPEPKDMTVDMDTKDGPRRFFAVDLEARSARYVAGFEKRSVKAPPAITPELAAAAFDQLWEAFDRDYGMFVLRPEVDWAKLREEHRPRALASRSTYEFAGVCAEMLKPLRDLHVWLTVAGANVPVYNRPRAANANPAAYLALLGQIQTKGRVQWVVTPDKIGFLAIHGWNTGPEIPAQCAEALEQMRDTRGLVVDVRLNGGGDEPTAQKVAARFLAHEFVYSYSQVRNGAGHTNLTAKRPRSIQPRGPWRYDRPVVLLTGRKTMSSCESFVGMMTGATNVTTMGEATAGSSGNPKIVRLPLDMTVSVPRWIDLLPDGTPLDERGFPPQVRFEPKPGAFEGERDDLLAAALARLRPAPLPAKPIEGPEFDREADYPDTRPGRSAATLPDYTAAMKEEARDGSRPRVIAVTPTNDAPAVGLVTELRVRFDRPMEPLSLKLYWDAGGFTDCEFPKYDPEKHEFTIPVRLLPGALHQIVVNRPGFFQADENISAYRQRSPLEGFRSADQRVAGIFAWRFTTLPATTAQAKPVKAARVSPAPGSEVPMRTFMDIAFDQPMSPPTEGLPWVVARSGREGPQGNPQLIPRVEYDATQHSFRLPLILPPGKKVSFSLTGFRGADGTPAESVKLNYQVTEEELAEAERARAEADAQNPQMLTLLEGMRQKRDQLTSLAERVQTLALSGDKGVFNHLDSKSACFRWQKPDQFYGDASEAMMSCAAFRIGSDGQNWWWHYEDASGKKKLLLCPWPDMRTRNVSFCDPFGMTGRTPAAAAADLSLRLVTRDRQIDAVSHLLEAWEVSAPNGGSVWGQLTRWHVDAPTGRPAVVETFHPYGVIRTRFHYDTVNEPLPAAAFAVPKLEGLPPSPPEALDEDYTGRFINLRDGSDGRMSVRWGKQGPKGTSGGGLN